MKLQAMPNSEIESFLQSFESATKQIKDEIFRVSWYMRGGVSSQDLFHIYSYEDRQIMNAIIKDNIEATKNSRLALV
jgi:hypothetical protein